MVALDSYNWKTIFIIPFFLATTFLIAENNKAYSQTDPLYNSSRYIFEHPQKAIVLGEEAYNEAQAIGNHENRVIALAIISRAYTNLSNFEIAKGLIDSAETIVDRYEELDNILELTKARIYLYQVQGDYKGAIDLSETLIQNAKKQKKEKQQIDFLSIKSDLYRQQRRFEEAIIPQHEALKLAERLNDSSLQALCFRNLGSIYFQFSQFDQAQEWYLKAKILNEELKDTAELIAVVRNISLVNRDLGQFDLAENNLQEALQLANKTKMPDLMGEIYNLMGSLSVRKGNSTEALEYYSRSLQLREEAGFLSSVASTLENISRVQKELGQFEEASISLQKVIKTREELKDSRSLGSAYNELGNLYAEKGELADALMHYLKSLKIRQEANIQSDIAKSLTNIGLMYRRMGSHRNALKYFEQALDLISDKIDPIGKALIFIHIGNTLRDLDDPKEALVNYKQALELREQTGNKLATSQAMRSIANAHSDLQEYSISRKYLNQAQNILRELNDEKGIADTYNELGNVAQKENNLLLALEYFESASSIYANYSELDMRGLCIRKIGEIQTKLKRYDDASTNLNLALSLAKKTGNAKLIELTYLALHDLYKAKDLHKDALESYYSYIHIRDSLNSINQRETIWQASLDLELDKKAEEIKAIEGEVENLRTEAKIKTIQLEKQKLIRNFFAVILLFVILIAIGSVYGYFIIRQKNIWLNEANEKLAQSESDLKKLVQTKDKLFSIIAHDLRSPFTALIGLTEVLANQGARLSTEEVLEYGSMIHESSEKLLNLIDNLLHWSRSQTGKIKLVSQKISLDKMVADVVSILSLQANAKSIKIVSDVSKNLTTFADYDTISTVVRNLTSNAIKYTKPNGTVTISASQQNDKVLIKISDNGVGIEKDNLAKLFRIEESFSTKGTSQEAGTGLGLIVCKEFVELNNGQIWVDSIVGQGTTFTFSLPS